jgi:hypothetical protein
MEITSSYNKVYKQNTCVREKKSWITSTEAKQNLGFHSNRWKERGTKM